MKQQALNNKIVGIEFKLFKSQLLNAFDTSILNTMKVVLTKVVLLMRHQIDSHEDYRT